MSKFKIGLIQLSVNSLKQKNLERAQILIEDLHQKGADIVCLPECFNSPYGIQYFKEYAENERTGETVKFLSNLSEKLKIFIVGGSIPEEDNGNYFNTCFVFDKDGMIIGKHRKVHLFDIDIKGKMTFKESSVLSPGNHLTTFSTPFCKFGLGICYDIRFPDLARSYQNEGCQCLLYPAAFNPVTGPLHWKLLGRSTSVTNQLFTCLIAPATNENPKENEYISYGHTMAIDPMSRIISELNGKEDSLLVEIDLKEIDIARQSIPIMKQRRNDVYKK
ncbi:hypothetical protein SNEBB_005545 [Seison nebaliae]|nr:hypothetical protein SNEBB_005545 [Seison nebaliae]